MFEQRTIVDQIEIARDGTVRVRFSKQILDDGQVISDQYHRAAWGPGADFDASLKTLNASLVSIKAAPVADAEWDIIRPHIAVAHTPKAIEAFKAAQEARVAKLEAAGTVPVKTAAK